MVDSQPGKVIAFVPSPTLSLTNFSADTRDRFMFNENQLVLASLQQARAVFATARTRLGSADPADFVDFDEYRNLSGEFAYIDGSFQALDTTGAPTSDVNQIVIGFDQQVTTDTVIFWSTGFVDTTKIFVEHSFDNVTWFAAGSVTWVQIFDDTIEVFPGDIPPTGEYRYTGTIDSGNITARYWRTRGDAETNFVSETGSNPNKTFTAGDTTNFPSSGDLFVTFTDTSRSMTYTGKTSTTFTGVDDPFGTDDTTAITAISGNNPDVTLTLTDATNFPTSGIVKGVDKDPGASCANPKFTITYTGKVGNDLTGCAITPDPDDVFTVDSGIPQVLCGGSTSIRIQIGLGAYNAEYTALTLQNGDTLFSLFAFGNGVTEIQIIPTQDPILEHWNSDGAQVVTNAVEGDDYYDMAYDKNDDVYYALKFNDTIQGGSTFDPDEDFNEDTGTDFDDIRWIESTTNPYFQHSTASGTLDHKSSGGDGQLEGNYGIDDDFIADVELVSVFELSENDGYFSLEMKDYTDGNVYLASTLKGPYIPGTDTSGTFVAYSMTFTDTVGETAQLQDFRVDPAGMDYTFVGPLGSIVDYTILYNATTDRYDVTVSGISHPPAVPGLPYTLDSASFTIANLGTTPADGQGFVILVKVTEDPIVGTAVSGINLQIERASTNGYARYDDTDNPGVYDLAMVGNVPTDRMRVQLFGSPGATQGVGNDDINLSADNFTITGGTIFFDTAVFSVVTVDKNGDITQVSGVSDADGFAIKAFDIIGDPSVVYNRFLTPRSGIATNGADAGSGGEIFIKIDDTLYRYTKSSLPLVTETGSNAVATTTGEIPATGVTAFAYNGFSAGGLSYVEFILALSGVFVKSIDDSTLLAVPEKALLDVASINFPFAWNVSDLATLYYVDGTGLKLYDLNETKAGFVVVTSDKQVLAAGTGETAVITAQVLNVYGQPKSTKSMTFTVSAGDGAVSPATGCSGAEGKDTTTYTVGAAVGTASITVSVSDVTCVP